MDEVENPDLPAAGESSPTLGPVDDDEDSAVEIGSPPKSTVEEDDVLTSSADRRTPSSPRRLQLPTRPPLRREGSAQPPLRREGSAQPPQQPPPAPPSAPEASLDSPQEQPDSLTLADLKRLRGLQPNGAAAVTVPPPKLELIDCDEIYDFTYNDAESLPVELEEWFTYSAEERSKLMKCKAAFDAQWKVSPHGTADWMQVTEDVRRAFVSKRLETLAEKDGDTTLALMVLTYIALGVWEETGGREEKFKLQELFVAEDGGHFRLADYNSSSLQLRWIVAMTDTIHACDGLSIVYQNLRKACDEALEPRPGEQSFRNEPLPRRPDESITLWCSLTLTYLFIEVARTTSGINGQQLKADIIALEPNLLKFFTQTVAKLRWDDGAPVPLTKMLLLSWKTILVTIGGIRDVENVKTFLREDKTEDEKDKAGQSVITASPLDYHLFRQELSSKYPAYQPPPPLFPLEPENNSILPPLKHRRSSYAFAESAYNGAPSVGTDSIMHQPIHIATPAPSPPPTPGGPGKAGKKQNYQTNQMFPFLYPPLDLSSNELGGKGDTQLQDALVGRRWDGSDIPASILEAAELFAKRMRATRAMKQLWEVRVDFMKYERGWKATDEMYDDIHNTNGDDAEFAPENTNESISKRGADANETKEQRQLAAVANFYRDSLPHLQSVVIVLLKAILQNVTDIVSRGNGSNGLQPGIQFNEPNGSNGSVRPIENGTVGDADDLLTPAEDLDRLRTQEIASKAISAILILLLKWFKVSHVLQYEYMTQLLLDSNYVPLLLKLWQTFDIGRACHFRLEREELNFFRFCQEQSSKGAVLTKALQEANGETNETHSTDPDTEDEAIPPPIRLQRNTLEQPLPQSDFNHPPEIDELGYPQPKTPLPSTPITTYSYRNVFSSINYLRALQKVTRRKTHRALLLVRYKSSNHLKRSLKIPIRLLRYYTLKLFKSQVPFCGRKWRQGNMKIITAVWLSIPAELRDDWLSGGGGGMGGACVGDVDGTVEDALPLEQSLRQLTHWWNVKNYPDVMGIEKGVIEEEMDYFRRELEKMEGLELAREFEEGLEEERFAEEMGVPGAPGTPWPQGPMEGY